MKFWLNFQSKFNKSEIFNDEFFFNILRNNGFLGYFCFLVAKMLYSLIFHIFYFVLNSLTFQCFPYRGKFFTLTYTYLHIDSINLVV